MSSQDPSNTDATTAMEGKQDYASVEDGGTITSNSKYAQYQIDKKGALADKALEKTIEAATKQESSKKPCHLLEAPPELRLIINELVFGDMNIDADSTTLDTAVTRPGLLHVNKLIRAEAMRAYLNGVFKAIMRTRKTQVALRIQYRKVMAGIDALPVRDYQNNGRLMLIAAPLLNRTNNQSLTLTQYARWLKAKVTSLESAQLVSDPSMEVVAAFKEVAKKAARPTHIAPLPELMEVMEQLEKQQRRREAS